VPRLEEKSKGRNRGGFDYPPTRGGFDYGGGGGGFTQCASTGRLGSPSHSCLIFPPRPKYFLTEDVGCADRSRPSQNQPSPHKNALARPLSQTRALSQEVERSDPISKKLRCKYLYQPIHIGKRGGHMKVSQPVVSRTDTCWAPSAQRRCYPTGRYT